MTGRRLEPDENHAEDKAMTVARDPLGPTDPPPADERPTIAPPPSEPTLDTSMLDEIIDFSPEGGKELLRELADMFFAETTTRLKALHDGIAQSDADIVTRAAHALKGTSSNLGAAQVAACCGRLEAQARQGRLTGAARLIQEVEAELPRFRAALEQRLVAVAGE